MAQSPESTLVQALQNACRYDFPVDRVEIVETHISWVLLTGRFAYKIKKPVNFGFVDFSTLEKRRAACVDELRLNQRLAPQLYLDVVPITGTPSEPVLGGHWTPIEYAVKIVEFPRSARLDRVLDAGRLLPQHMDDLAVELAEFHGRVDRVDRRDADSPYLNPLRFYQPIERNLKSMRQLVAEAPASEEAETVDEINRHLAGLAPWAQSEFARHEAIFAGRALAGCVRECHGDLHLANMLLLDDRIVLFDCLEFSAELRWIDVLNELAFAVMDLASRNRDDLARRLANAYLEITGDYAGLPVFRYYLVYRAMVRANVALLRWAQGGLPPGEDGRLWLECRDYLRLADRFTKPRTPKLLLTHGFSGSGKSVGAQAFVETTDAFRLRSDVERKRQFKGLGNAMYGPAANRASYARLGELARSVIAADFTAVIDATFLRRADRDALRDLAAELQVPLAILDFRTPEALLRQRIEKRAAAGQDASDADLAVLEEQLRGNEPLQDDERPIVAAIDSPEPIAGEPFSVERLICEIDARASVPAPVL